MRKQSSEFGTHDSKAVLYTFACWEFGIEEVGLSAAAALCSARIWRGRVACKYRSKWLQRQDLNLDPTDHSSLMTAQVKNDAHLTPYSNVLMHLW